MTTHELAAKLLEGPDVPAVVVGDCATDALVCDPGEVSVVNRDGKVQIRGWASETKMVIS